MRVLVTGGRGFIGSHLVDALVERGDEVLVVDNGLSGDNENPGARYTGMVPVGLGDYDAIFHLAAIGRTTWAVEDPVLCWQTNLMFSVDLLEAVRWKGTPFPRVVLSSSNIVYAADTPYKASKLAMEDAAGVYSNLYGLSTICLRYANTYGPRQSEEGIGPNVFPALRKSLREKGHIEITGDGHQSRNFIHVSDVVRANLLAAESEAQGNYDICTDKNWSMRQVAELLGAEVRYIPDREGDIKHIWQNAERARQDLGFEAKVSLEDGIWDCFSQKVAA